MILTFELVRPETVSEERFLSLVRRARQIAIEIEGVYDLALYQSQETEQNGVWQCSIDVDDKQAWGLLKTDPRFRRVVDEAKKLGVRAVADGQLERRI
jgi:hypothetical protein